MTMVRKGLHPFLDSFPSPRITSYVDTVPEVGSVAPRTCKDLSHNLTAFQNTRQTHAVQEVRTDIETKYESLTVPVISDNDHFVSDNAGDDSHCIPDRRYLVVHYWINKK